MKKVKRWRYYCDYCKKAGGSQGHMEAHEKHCTLNPERSCRVCYLLGDLVTKPVSELIALLPDPEEHWNESHNPYQDHTYYSSSLKDATHAALPALREATEECPACIMAAIRQAGIPVPMVTNFDFKKEMDSLWPYINDLQADQGGHG